MKDALTPLSVAFIWHMHQPDYKDHLTGEYLMPWSRLHAVKDYLDMVKVLENYPKIKQTFNLVPSLMDQIEDYTRPETRDRYMTITLKETFDDADRLFIFERFFDAAAHTMIAKSGYYYNLYERRNAMWELRDPLVFTFSDEEYQDITALFHLVWIDPLWYDTYPQLKALWEKGRDFTWDDRKAIIDIHTQIVKQVLPEYRKAQESGQIDVITTPYYHPILPLLIDSESARVAMPDAVLPEERFQHPEDALAQISNAKNRYIEVMGRPPVGMWPSEQSVSPEAAKLIAQEGFQWAVTSDGILANSLGVHLEKDPFGNVLNAEVLCQPYQFEGLNFIFRNLTLSDLIGFHYASMPAEQAAHDFYHRLKQIQKRCTLAGLKHPIATIALDGENCWEFFPNDGHDFLNALYRLMSNDETLNVCRVSDYFAQVPQAEIKSLPRLFSGSWINSNFHIWIADPVKNAGWTYLSRTRKDLVHLENSGHYQPETLKKAWQEIYIAEGSDWFWWYGEPHNSGQDDLFDMQFRRHLANVYRLLDAPIPDYLDVPLTVTMGRPVIMPSGPITPSLDGKYASLEDWGCAGCLDLTHGAMHRDTRVLKKVWFGSDSEQFYLRFAVNHDALTPYHEVFVYMITPGKTRFNSPIRIKSASPQTVPTQRYYYAYEVQLLPISADEVIATGAEAVEGHLWLARPDLIQAVVFDEVLEFAIPFNAVNTHPDETVQLVVATAQGGVLDEFQPERYILSVERFNSHPTGHSADIHLGFRPDHPAHTV